MKAKSSLFALVVMSIVALTLGCGRMEDNTEVDRLEREKAEAETRAEKAEEETVTKAIRASNSGWTTIMDVKRGQTLRIDTRGSWNPGPRVCDANGFEHSANWGLKKITIGYMQGRIGGNVPFKIGDGGEFEVSDDGNLQVQMYDEAQYYGDNTGKIDITVTILPDD